MNALDIALNFERNQNIAPLERQTEVFETIKSNDDSIPIEVLENIAPFTLYVHDNRPYYHNGKNVELHQKKHQVSISKPMKTEKLNSNGMSEIKIKFLTRKKNLLSLMLGKDTLIVGITLFLQHQRAKIIYLILTLKHLVK